MHGCPAVGPSAGGTRYFPDVRLGHHPYFEEARMPSYLSPGVYMEEVSAGAKPIEAVGTATAAFVGFTEKGPVNQPVLVTSWPQYTREFGEFVDGAYLPLAMFNYFLNGGGNAYVVRVGADDDGEDGGAPSANGHRKVADGGTSSPPGLVRPAVAQLSGAEGGPSLTVRSQAPAEEATGLSVRVSPASEGGEGTFKLEVVSGDDVVETYDNVGVKRGSGNV